jgi:hypothetical protein
LAGGRIKAFGQGPALIVAGDVATLELKHFTAAVAPAADAARRVRRSR